MHLPDVASRFYLWLLGLMASTLLKVPQARLYMRPFQMYLNAMWSRVTQGLDYNIMTLLKLVPILQWLQDMENLTQGLTWIKPKL